MDISSIRKMKFIKNIDLFKCPICGKEMNIHDANSLFCLDKHSFDLAKKGYVNLLLSSGKTEYNQEMLESRKKVNRMGFFKLMIDGINDLLLETISNTDSNEIKILDAGCGEGSHLAEIVERLKQSEEYLCDSLSTIAAIGLDISKEGIQIAAKNYHDIIWCVADLARIPLKDSQMDIILNILSPSNYSEFKRILNNNGLIVKVIPGSNYLKELRSVFYEKTDKETYSNENVLKHFANSFKIMDIKHISDGFKVSKEDLKHIIRMTPLSWGVTRQRQDKVLNAGITSVTIDMSIILGKKYI